MNRTELAAMGIYVPLTDVLCRVICTTDEEYELAINTLLDRCPPTEYDSTRQVVIALNEYRKSMLED